MAKGCWLFIKLYWKAILGVLIPIVLLPIVLLHNRPAIRCLYVVCVMCGYWVFEILPLGVTGLIPVICFPLMNVLDSKKVAPCYFRDTNMLFLGGLMVAASLEHCQLHTRIALNVIKLIGCSPRKLLVGLVMVTVFASFWISNTAATACMVPVITATLKEIEKLGIGGMWQKEDQPGPSPTPISSLAGVFDEDEGKKPTHLTLCYFTSIAYGSSIGGLGTLVGTSTNMVLKGTYEELFPGRKEIIFIEWMFVAVPVVLVALVPMIIWLQFLYMGLFRPKSRDALAIKVGKEGEQAAKVVIKGKLEDLGPWTFQQIAVGTLFIFLVLLWFFKRPHFMPGWVDLITTGPVTDSLPAIFVSILMFLVPAKPYCFRAFSKDEERRPNESSPALVNWKLMQAKIPWNMLLLMGGGFAIAEGARQSGMSKEVAQKLAVLHALPRIVVLILASSTACLLTQFTSNVAMATVILPVLGQLADDQGIDPLYYMIPAAMACSFAFCLPVSTPPNAIIADAGHISSIQMLKVGVGVEVICLLVMFGIFPLMGHVVYDL